MKYLTVSNLNIDSVFYYNNNFFYILYVYRSIGSYLFQNKKTEKRKALIRRHCKQSKLAIRVDAVLTRAAEPSFG